MQDLASPLSQILVEEQGSTSTTYLYGLERFAAVQESTRTWEVHNALGSVRQVLDDTGGRVASSCDNRPRAPGNSETASKWM